MIPIAKPLLDEQEKQSVLDVLDSGMLTRGEVVENFEKKYASFIGTRYGVATSSGTAALHAALEAVGIKEGDQVLTTAFSFIASSNAILYCGGQPVFADIDKKSFNISVESIEKKLQENPDIKALLIVHLYGLACEMDAIMELVDKYDLILIEDCAQAHGAQYKGKKVGTFGEVSIFSFYPSKNITTGEGGIILTDNKNIKEKVCSLINHGAKQRYEHEILGYNYRMTNIAAAIGLQQLQKLEKFNKKRRDHAEYLSEKLKPLKEKGLKTPHYSDKYYHVYHLYTLQAPARDKLAKNLENNEIGYSIHYPLPLYKQPLYKKKGFDNIKLSVTENICEKVISVPVHPDLSEKDLDLITGVINDFYC